jgi:hypothetical protein
MLHATERRRMTVWDSDRRARTIARERDAAFDGTSRSCCATGGSRKLVRVHGVHRWKRIEWPRGAPCPSEARRASRAVLPIDRLAERTASEFSASEF